MLHYLISLVGQKLSIYINCLHTT